MVRAGDGTPRAAARSANVTPARARTPGRRPALRRASSTHRQCLLHRGADRDGMGRANSTRSPVCSSWMRQTVWVRVPAATSVGGHSRRISRRSSPSEASQAASQVATRTAAESTRVASQVRRGQGRRSHPRPGVRWRERCTSRALRGRWVGGAHAGRSVRRAGGALADRPALHRGSKTTPTGSGKARPGVSIAVARTSRPGDEQIRPLGAE
jgi:hypothetical protein